MNESGGTPANTNNQLQQKSESRLNPRKMSTVTNKSFSKYFEPNISPSQSLSSQGAQQQQQQSAGMSLRSNHKRSQSLGHANISSLNDISKGILIANDKDSSKSQRSFSSLQKKRISWGPSKVREFFATDNMMMEQSQENSEEMKDQTAEQVQKSSNQALPYIFKSTANTSNKRVGGGILKNAKEGGGNSSQGLEQAKKRISLMKVVKEYEAPLIDSSVIEDENMENQEENIKSSKNNNKQQDVEMADDTVNHMSPKQKTQDQIEAEILQNKMNDEPTPRKSDVFDQSKIDEQSKRRSLNNLPSSGQTFDLRKSIDQDQIKQLQKQNQVVTAMPLEESKSNSQDVMPFTTAEKDKESGERAAAVGSMTEGGGLHNQTLQSTHHKNHNQSMPDLERPSLFSHVNTTQQNQSFQEEPDNSTEQLRLNQIQQQLQNQSQSEFQKSVISQNQGLIKNRNSFIPAFGTTRLSFIPAQPAQQEQEKSIRIPSRMELLKHLLQVDEQKINELQSLNNQVINEYLNVIVQQKETDLQLQNLVVLSELAQNSHFQECRKQLDQLSIVQNKIDEKRTQVLEENTRLKNQALQTIDRSETLQSYNQLYIDWDSTDSKSLLVKIFDIIEIKIDQYQQQQKSIQLNLNPEIIECLPQKSMQIIDRILKSAVRKVQRRLNKNQQQQQNENRQQLIQAKTSDIVKLIQKIIFGIEKLFKLLSDVNIVEINQKQQHNISSEMLTLKCQHINEEKMFYEFNVDLSFVYGVNFKLDQNSIRVQSIDIVKDKQKNDEITQKAKEMFRQFCKYYFGF